ncbi:winged helix-turn-helix domain-containing protein [Citrobacter koseri]|uniref:winged helix-turn-helix domain-containing protein n=1 Tax=Citrobacter koseri TaxID=545 RepID=UPI0037037ABD
MKKGFLINSFIEFWPEECLLISRNTNTTTLLTSPSSRCFSLMLNSFPEIISHETLSHEIWQSDNVPLNTIYQNISLIRRGLQSIVGHKTDIVVTISRKGFKINDTAIISEITDSPDNLHSPSDKPDSSDMLPSQRESKPKHKPHALTLTLLIIVIITVQISILYKIDNADNNYFHDYSLLHTINGCSVFINNNAAHINETAIKIGEQSINCRSYPYAYITSFQYTSHIPVIICNAPLKSGNTPRCISHNFRGIPGI